MPAFFVACAFGIIIGDDPNQEDALPDFKLTDHAGASIDIDPGPLSAAAKYFKAAPQLFLEGKSLHDLDALTISDPAVTSLQTKLTVKEPVPAGIGGVGFSLNAGLAANFGIFVPDPTLPSGTPDILFSADEFGEDVSVAADERYVSAAFTATVGAGASMQAPESSFGITDSSSFTVANYRKFTTAAPVPSMLRALSDTLAGFQMPMDIADLEAMAVDSIVSLTGKGSLKFSGKASLSPAVTTLATADLGSLLPKINVEATAEVSVAGSYQLSGTRELRIRKIAANRIRLGYYRDRGSDLEIRVAAEAGISAGIGGGDLFGQVIGAISPDARADYDELNRAGIDATTLASIQATVQAGIERSLELAVSYELGSTRKRSAAFLFEVDLGALDERGRTAIWQAIRGDLTMLLTEEDGLPAGIAVKRNIFQNIRQGTHTFKLNLLGIYNYISVSKLTLNGTIVVDSDTGHLTITDTATASRIQAGMLNVGGQPNRADPKQLALALASSFLITAAYQGTGMIEAPPQLGCSQRYAAVHNRTNTETMQDELDVAVGLGLLTASEAKALLASAGDFGRTLVYAQTSYAEPQVESFFLSDGTPRPETEYHAFGRTAMQVAIHEDAADRFRLVPLRNDAIWTAMSRQGPPAFRRIFSGQGITLTDLQVNTVIGDFTAITDWARAMHSTAEKLVTTRDFLAKRPNPAARDKAFQKVRQDLADHMKSVAANTHAAFAGSWGLIVMDLLSGGRSAASVAYTGPVISLTRVRQALTAAGRES